MKLPFRYSMECSLYVLLRRMVCGLYVCSFQGSRAVVMDLWMDGAVSMAVCGVLY
jgi:hypothetical protein